MTYPSQLKYVIFGKESSWGTRTATPADAGLIITDVTNPITREINESQGISSVTVQKISTGMLDPGVTFEGDFQHGRMLELILGSVSHDDQTDWKHTFTTSNSAPSATIETGNNSSTDSVLVTTGCLVESAELSIALNENLKLSVEFKGKNVIGESTAASSILSSLPIFPHALVNVYLDGVQATEVQTASISFNKVIERSGGVSSNIYQQGHATEMKFEFAANLGFQNTDYYRLFLTGTATAIPSAVTAVSTADPTGTEFKIQADNGVAAGSGRREISITLENCQYSAFTETTSVGSLTFIDLTGSGTLKECFTYDNIADTSW